MKKIMLLFLAAMSIVFGQQKKSMLVEDMWLMERLDKACLSPDGSKIVFAASTYSMDLNKGNSDIYIMNSDGSELKKIARTPEKETNPKFSPDGKKVSYLCNNQIWLCNTDGSEAEKITDLYSGIDDYTWSPDSRHMLLTSFVYPECASQECVKEKDKQKEESKVNASIFTELMYRHWDDWRGEKRSHLFLFDLNSKKATDVTLYSKSDVAPLALGSDHDFCFSPDGSEIAFATNPDKVIALSTNNEIYTIKTAGIGTGAEPKKITESKGNDNQPCYSPDGRFIAYCSMERAGYEADRQRLMLYDRAAGTSKNLTPKFDRSIGEMVWSPDSKAIYFISSNEVHESIYKIDIATGKIDLVIKEYGNKNLMISPDGAHLYFKQERTNLPFELFSASAEGKNLTQLTSLNKARLDKIEMLPAETFWSKGADGHPVQSLLIKPPFFDAAKKYPMIFLIHGGPQGHWSEDFHYRWNVQMFAALGYVVVAPNPRGSTGYGQKFTDEINGDWGGKPYTDLMNACDYAIKNFSYIDSKNIFAAGASYGGYMINWLAGHTNRFNALVCHDGVFNLESMYGTTEELWFPEWENKGTPWSNRKLYQKFSPHMYIQNCKTPMLVVHGGKDFRVPEEQAFQLFTSLQRLGVESKFLYFPLETHFVQKPQNAKLWWSTIDNWFAKHKK